MTYFGPGWPREEYGDIPVIRSEHCPPGSAYMLNTAGMKQLVIHRPRLKWWQRLLCRLSKRYHLRKDPLGAVGW